MAPEPQSSGGEAKLEPGSTFGKYRIVRKIGEGGMATIYLASNVGPDGFSKPCALKLIRPEFSSRPEINRMLVQEAKIAGLLNHPNIVQVFDFGKVDEVYYLTMEWIDGATLGETLVQSVRTATPIGIGTAAHIGLSIAEALAYLQDGVHLDGQVVNLVHRDVTPSNVLISTAGSVKLTDFGIVKVLEAPTVTNVGVVKGKYAYMSPEQLRGDPIDHRSDIFALGVILFEAVTRQRLFRRKTLAGTVAAVHAARVPAPSTINPDVPADFDRVISRALAKNPAERYQSAREMIDDLWPIVSAHQKRGMSELTRIIQKMPRSAALGRREPRNEDDRAPARPPDPTPSHEEPLDMVDAQPGSSEEFEDLEHIAGELVGIDEEGDHSTGANNSWTEPGTPSSPVARAPRVYEAAFEGQEATRVRPVPGSSKNSPARGSDRMITIVVVAASIIATIIFWAFVLR